MEKIVKLKDGSQVTIRNMREDDVQASYDFFQSLSEEDRKYLRVDVTSWEVVERRASDLQSGRVKRVVVTDGDRIVADGAIELAGHGWGENIAEIRLIVANAYQRSGLGTILARELHFVAAEHKVDRIVARLMRPQVGAHRILHHLGFHEEFLIPEMVRDRSGSWQDMIIMRCNLEDLWREMETLFEYSDRQLHR